MASEDYRGIVEQFGAAAGANLEQCTSIADLCRIIGAEPRTVLRAFHAIHATTPSRYLRALRLRLARQALLAPGAESRTVTQVATRYGFRELGRFSVEYRKTFGETPSETLRRSVTNS